MALVHRHGAPLLLAALRGLLRALGASPCIAPQPSAAAAAGGGGGGGGGGGALLDEPGARGAAELPRAPPAAVAAEAAVPLPLECTRHVSRLLEEVAAKAHRKALVRHAAYLLADVLALFVHRPPSPAHRAELLPGVHALLSMCTTVELQECHAGSDGMGKRALQALRETYEATRFKGKV
jgi:hypothetical protein